MANPERGTFIKVLSNSVASIVALGAVVFGISRLGDALRTELREFGKDIVKIEEEVAKHRGQKQINRNVEYRLNRIDKQMDRWHK